MSVISRLHTGEGRWIVTMSMGDREIHRETFIGLADASTQAGFLRDDFTRQGWTEVFSIDLPTY